MGDHYVITSINTLWNNLINPNLQRKITVFQFECWYTSSGGVSWGKLYIILAALQGSNFKDCRRSVFEQLPQLTSPHKTDDNIIILKYKSNRRIFADVIVYIFTH